jgi:hypothetical protein
MEYEKLVIELSARKAGLTPVTPHVLKGDSGIDHKVSLLFTDGSRLYGFDFYDTVGELEVVRTYAKKFDSKASINIVCLRGEITEAARSLAHSYDMRILSPKTVEEFLIFEPVANRAESN